MENGRESRKDNDLFFTCALIDYIARKTKNTRSDVVNALGKKRLEKIYDLADIYHIDNVGECQYAIPTHWDIGKVYKRLIKQVSEKEKIEVIDALIKVYNSFLSGKIDDYNSSVYYENPSYLFECYEENKILQEKSAILSAKTGVQKNGESDL